MNNIAVTDNNKYKICMNCLGELNGGISKDINGLGYGSNFDNLSTRIQLCESCYQENPNIWGFKEVDISSSMGFNDGELFAYEFEDEIIEYIDNMPLAGQELFWNRFAYKTMNPQDWIDYKLNILPHDKCKEYGLYSPDEINSDKYTKDIFDIAKDTGNNPAYVELILISVVVSMHKIKGRPIKWDIIEKIIESLDNETKRNLVLLYNIIQ